MRFTARNAQIDICMPDVKGEFAVAFGTFKTV